MKSVVKLQTSIVCVDDENACCLILFSFKHGVRGEEVLPTRQMQT